MSEDRYYPARIVGSEPKVEEGHGKTYQPVFTAVARGRKHPVDPMPGQVYYDMAGDALYCWDGSAWQDARSGSQVDADLTVALPALDPAVEALMDSAFRQQVNTDPATNEQATRLLTHYDNLVAMRAMPPNTLRLHLSVDPS